MWRAISAWPIHRHVIDTHFDPHLLSHVASYDVACNISARPYIAANPVGWRCKLKPVLKLESAWLPRLKLTYEVSALISAPTWLQIVPLQTGVCPAV